VLNAPRASTLMSDVSACADCVEGEYQQAAGQTSCSECGDGSVTNTGEQGGASSCTECSVGKYSDVSACADCVKGEYQPDPAKSPCIVCEICGDGEGRTSCGLAGLGPRPGAGAWAKYLVVDLEIASSQPGAGKAARSPQGGSPSAGFVWGGILGSRQGLGLGLGKILVLLQTDFQVPGKPLAAPINSSITISRCALGAFASIVTSTHRVEGV
jgi:hypothetical protein